MVHSLESLIALRLLIGVSEAIVIRLRRTWPFSGTSFPFRASVWERTQESSIYIIHPDGSGWKKIASKPGFDESSPTWSPDGKYVAFYETPVESTWGAHRPEFINKVSSQIESVDLAAT
ncbi:TolB family protein [Pseudomonas sp. M47T1]|uniref:TolB family protein n=1 Tax=Pseudomonas sp. M47T1 TaxID=1179778 RepID=UPI001930B7A4|nr:PD40 domain-containing protein [Pseudomonas sp. M47T1]